MASQPAPQQLKFSWREEIRYLKLPQQLISLHHKAMRMKTHHPQGILFDSIKLTYTTTCYKLII